MADDASPPEDVLEASGSPRPAPRTRPSVPHARHWPRPPRAVLIGVGAATALAVAGLNALSNGGPIEGASGPLNAAVTDDRVPRGPVLTSVPQDCGVSGEVARRLAPPVDRVEAVHSEHSGACTWETEETAFASGGVARTLEVRIRKAWDERTSPAAWAMANFDRSVASALRATGKIRPDEPRRVSGLGDEAVAVERTGDGLHGGPERRLTVIFRAGNTVVVVDYGGGDRSGGDGGSRPPAFRAMDAAAVRAGAFMAAGDIADNLELTPGARPALAPRRPRQPVLENVPTACDLLSRQDAERVGATGTGPPQPSSLTLLSKDAPGLRVTRCPWESGLALEVATLDDTATAGGVETARREYLRHYLSSRHAGPIGGPQDVQFVPLTGLGEEGFLAFGRGELGDGKVQVVFRVRNVLLMAECTTGDSESASDEFDRTFTLAKTAAATLPH